ncbi:hypothetical protein AHAS_Ahas02G0163700 [Arachis hypogaea]
MRVNATNLIKESIPSYPQKSTKIREHKAGDRKSNCSGAMFHKIPNPNIAHRHIIKREPFSGILQSDPFEVSCVTFIFSLRTCERWFLKFFNYFTIILNVQLLN